LQNHAVGTLDLAVSSRVGYCGPVHADVMLIAEIQELSTGELGAIVGDDDIGDPKSMDDVGEEKDGLLGADVSDWSSLDPFGELVNSHQQMGIPSFCLL
jgi:hypothetical protein